MQQVVERYKRREQRKDACRSSHRMNYLLKFLKEPLRAIRRIRDLLDTPASRAESRGMKH